MDDAYDGPSRFNQTQEEEDKEARVIMSQQVRDLFARLDIPIQSIPLGTQLPWRSFESLLVNHAVRRKGKPAGETAVLGGPQGKPATSSPKSATRIAPLSSVPLQRHASQLLHRAPSATSPRLPSSRNASFRVNHGSVETPTAAKGPSNNREGGDLYDPAVHSLSLMLVNDATHIPTIDSTLHDMQVSLRRMDGMSIALSQGRPFRPRSDTQIEPGIIHDPELRTIAELRRTVEVLRSDVATHSATIRRLENELTAKKNLICHLREELSLYRDKDPFAGEHLDDGAVEDDDTFAADSKDDAEQQEREKAPQSPVVVQAPSTRVSSSNPLSDADVPPASHDTQSGPSCIRRESCQTDASDGSSDIVAETVSYTFATTDRRDSGCSATPHGGTASFLADAGTTVSAAVFNATTDASAVFSAAGHKPHMRKGFNVRERFQNAVMKIKTANSDDVDAEKPFAPGVLTRTKAGFARLPQGSALRARLSISSIVAFRESVLDSLSRRHVVFGLSMFERLKQAALFEATLVTRLIDSVSKAGEAAPSATRRTSVKPQSSRASFSNTLSANPSLAGADEDDTQQEAAHEYFSLAPHRIFEVPVYFGPRAQPFADTLYFLAISISHKTLLAESIDSSAWSSAVTQSVFFIESVIRNNAGHIITSENHDFLIVFDNPMRMVLSALEIQFDLANTPNITWPAEVMAHPLLPTSRDVHSAVKRYVWRGLRVSMCMDAVPVAGSSGHYLRDVCDTGGAIYNGPETRMCMWMAANCAPPGSIVTQEAMSQWVERSAVELDDPTVEFWSWRHLPGAVHPTKFFEVYHRAHSSRRSESQNWMRFMYRPPQLKLLTDPTSPATLERLVVLHNQQAAKQGFKAQNRDDESILGLEGTVEQRLTQLRELPAPTSEEFRRPAYEELFLAHVPALPPLPQPEHFAQLPSGDVCVILITIPVYDCIVRFVDDALASSYIRRVFRLAKELATKHEFGGVSFVRSSRDRIMFATMEPIEAIRFALVLQDQLFHLSPWPRDGNLPPGLVAMLEPKKAKHRVVADGPTVHCALHYFKAKPTVEAFGLQQAYYTSPELSVLEDMTFNAPENTNTVFLSDVMFAILYAREAELPMPQPFVECVGVLDRKSELRCIYAMTPRSLVRRLVMFPSALWNSYRRWAARQYATAISSGNNAKREGDSCIPGSGVENAIMRFSPPQLTPAEKRAVRRHYRAADLIHRARQLRPTYHALAQSSTITSTKIQAACAKMYFELSRKENRLQSVLASAVSVAAHRGRTADLKVAEKLECGVMELHDPLMPTNSRGISDVGLDILSLQELSGGSSGGAFVHTHPSSATSTPKSSSHHMTRTSSGRNLAEQRSHGKLPPPLNLGGSATHDHGKTPRGDGEVSPSGSPRGPDNHEIRALLDIDKERQFIIHRTKKIESEVLLTHHAVQYFLQVIEAYLHQLLSVQATKIADEEVILKCMQKLNTLRDDSKKVTDDSESEEDEALSKLNQLVGEKSSSDDDADQENAKDREEEKAYQLSLQKIRVNERWRDSLASVVDLQHSEAGGDYDPVLLCRSIVGQLCKHFITLRTVSRRVVRVNDALERAQRTMDPATRIGKALETAADRELQRQRAELEASREKAADVVQLGALDEDTSLVAAMSLRAGDPLGSSSAQ